MAIDGCSTATGSLTTVFKDSITIGNPGKPLNFWIGKSIGCNCSATNNPNVLVSCGTKKDDNGAVVMVVEGCVAAADASPALSGLSPFKGSTDTLCQFPKVSSCWRNDSKWSECDGDWFYGLPLEWKGGANTQIIWGSWGWGHHCKSGYVALNPSAGCIEKSACAKMNGYAKPQTAWDGNKLSTRGETFDRCEVCANTQVVKATGDGCMDCPSGKVPNPATNSCIECPELKHSNVVVYQKVVEGVCRKCGDANDKQRLNTDGSCSPVTLTSISGAKILECAKSSGDESIFMTCLGLGDGGGQCTDPSGCNMNWGEGGLIFVGPSVEDANIDPSAPMGVRFESWNIKCTGQNVQNSAGQYSEVTVDTAVVMRFPYFGKCCQCSGSEGKNFMKKWYGCADVAKSVTKQPSNSKVIFREQKMHDGTTKKCWTFECNSGYKRNASNAGCVLEGSSGSQGDNPMEY